MKVVVPPGGFPAFAQQTAATQRLFQAAGRIGGQKSAAKRRRKASTKAAAPRKRRRAAVGRVKARKGKARLVKGSAAAKRYMASIRRKRKR